MTLARADFWTELLGAGTSAPGGVRVQMRLLKKGGRPLLLLPRPGGLASVALDLYPAQSGRARLARRLVGLLLKASLPLGTTNVCFSVAPAEPFIRFLSSLAGDPGPSVPSFGILAGNAATQGRRFLFLVFGADHKPKAVVKAGLSAEAKALIQREQSFLAQVPANTAGVPHLRETFENARLRSFAIDYLPGRSPKPEDTEAFRVLLGSWLDQRSAVAVSDFPEWQHLQRNASGAPLFGALAQGLRGRHVHPALYHGDFAPWNIRVSPAGDWTAIDWERGQCRGMPAWDWFHYVIQPEILVRRLPTAGLVEQVEAMLSSDGFRRYAEGAAIVGVDRPLVLAYLLHCVEVIKPSEGLLQTRGLLQALATRWDKNWGGR